MFSSPLVLQIPPSMQITDEQFFEFCQLNRDLRIERDQCGNISIMSLTNGKTGNRDEHIFSQLYAWSEQDGTGIAFDSSTRFKLSTSANRLPNASWMKLERWNTLSSKQKELFVPLFPNFIVEFRSLNENLQPIKEKMEEYMREPGVQLGWLIDRQHRKVYIYRPGNSAECLDNPHTVSGDPVLPGFVLNMSKIW
jgi:Uma2 family endonuclease